nr:hypothetical protein CFP56_23803 [Quercus suber]
MEPFQTHEFAETVSGQHDLRQKVSASPNGYALSPEVLRLTEAPAPRMEITTMTLDLANMQVMGTWEILLTANTQGLIDGGRPELFWSLVWAYFGQSFVILSVCTSSRKTSKRSTDECEVGRDVQYGTNRVSFGQVLMEPQDYGLSLSSIVRDSTITYLNGAHHPVNAFCRTAVDGSQRYLGSQSSRPIATSSAAYSRHLSRCSRRATDPFGGMAHYLQSQRCSQ